MHLWVTFNLSLWCTLPSVLGQMGSLSPLSAEKYQECLWKAKSDINLAQSCLKSLTQGLQGDLRAGTIASGLKMNISFLAPVITLLGCQVLEDNSSGWMTHGKPFASGSLLQGKLDDYTEWPHWPTQSLPLLTYVFFFSHFEFYFAVSSRLSKSISS